MSETPIVTFSSLDNPNTWGVEGESKRLVFASPSEAKRAEELFTAMQRALTAERERADRNQEDAERWRAAELLFEAGYEMEDGEPAIALFLPEHWDPNEAIDAARRK